MKVHPVLRYILRISIMLGAIFAFVIPTQNFAAGSSSSTDCTSVTQLATPNGLTDAMRQTTVSVSGGLLPGNDIDALNYSSLFGVSPNTSPSGDPDIQGFGFPGNNRTRISLTNIARGKYLALKFRAPSNVAWNHVRGSHFLIPGDSFTLAAIAPCPGQFASDTNYPMNNSACRVYGEDQINAQIESGSISGCALIPGHTYYLNIIKAGNNNFTNLTTPTCSGSTCTARMLIYSYLNP